MQFQLSKTVLLSCSIALLISGCSGVKTLIPKKQEASIPTWYLNAPNNTSENLYGEGEGDSIQDAKDNALNTMASKLVVSVGSSVQTTTQASLDSYSKNVTKDIKVEVQKIKFTNAKVEKSLKIGDDFYILMSVNRDKLFINNKKEFDILDQRIDTQYKSSKSFGTIEQIYALKELYPQIKKAKNKSIVLNAIKNSFNQAPYIKKYDGYIDTIEKLKNNSTIKVTTNNKEGYFKDVLVNMLNQENFKVTQSNQNDVLIKLNNKVKYSIARGWNIAKVSTTLSVISNNKTVSNKIISVVGRSSTSKLSALDNASVAFSKKLKKLTLDKVLYSK